MTNKNKNTTSKNKKRLTLFLNPDTIKQARVQAILEELTLTAYIEKSIISSLPKEIVVKKAESK